MFERVSRYFRLYASFVKFAFMRSFEFRFDFMIRVMMDLVYYAVMISFYRLIFLHAPGLGGWNEDQTLIFAMGYCLLDATIMMIFADNLWFLPYQVNRGDMDFHLVRPVSTLFFVSLRHFSSSSFVNFLCALGLVFWSVARYPGELGAGAVLGFLLLIFNGAMLFYFVTACVTCLVFWTHSSGGLLESAWSLGKIAERPDGIYRGWFRRVVTTALPYSLMASFPARLLLEGWNWELLAWIAAADAAFFLILLAIWRAALRSYSSASS